jgi:ribokinase
MTPDSHPRITVVGSYVVGLTIRADRFPVAGETLIGRDFDLGPGGKGSNQAVGAARLGADCRLLLRLGQDDFARTALDLYAREGLDQAFILKTPEASTGVAVITLNAAGENHIILDVGANALLSPDDVDGLAGEMARSNVVMTVLEIPVPAAARAMTLGREQGARTILNPAPACPLPEAIFQDIDVITPNETELRVLLGLAPDSGVDTVELARDLQARGVQNVIVTLGAQGALILDARGDLTRVPGVPVNVVDTTGAGDAFNAGLGTALAEGRSLEEAVRFAVHAGALCCTRLGVIPALPTRAQVESLMD